MLRFTGALMLTLLVLQISGQQAEITHNSTSDTATAGPHLLLTESDDAGNADGSDGWTRLWLTNSSATDRWGILGRPHAGAEDNDGELQSPLVFAYNGEQKLGIGSDGSLRINRAYSLPNNIHLIKNGEALTYVESIDKVLWSFPHATLLRPNGDDDSRVFIFNPPDPAVPDTVYIQLNDGVTQWRNVMKISTTLIDCFRGQRIRSSSGTLSPQLLLREEEQSGVTRLFMGNNNTDAQWRILTRAFDGSTNPDNEMSITYDDGSTVHNFIQMDGDNTSILLDAVATRVDGALRPVGHKAHNLGANGTAWDNIYGDDFINQGAAAFHDISVTDELIAHPPMPKTAGSFDYKTERDMIELDPSSCPEYLTEDDGLLIDEMTSFNYKANYEQQLVINQQAKEIAELKKELAEMKEVMKSLVKQD